MGHWVVSCFIFYVGHLKVFIIEFVTALLLLYVLIFVDARHVGP